MKSKMTTIQDRIIKDFRDKWTKAPDYHDPNTHQNYPAKYIERMSSLGFFVNMDEVEQFLIQSIKEVEEETRKEVVEEYKLKMAQSNEWWNKKIGLLIKGDK